MVGIGVDERDAGVVCEFAGKDQGRRALARPAVRIGEDDGWHGRFQC